MTSNQAFVWLYLGFDCRFHGFKGFFVYFFRGFIWNTSRLTNMYIFIWFV
ncbi:hypothetical protein HanPSC8_Chr15g0647791 [Helianthus annuus]|nr:hypothetical protein HanPSC8_Chr15g0647791 [Helianthus annuus]